MRNNLEFRTAQIQHSLRQLRESGASVFGSEVHGFRLNEQLTESEALDFEQTHGIKLPAEYRSFITAIGNGGAGPFYGIFPLGFMDASISTGLNRWDKKDGLVGALSTPFSLDQGWNDLSKMPSDKLAESDPGAFEKHQETFEKEYWSSALVNGAIPICHEGCAIRIWLVTTGPQTGYLWRDSRSEFSGIRPLQLKNGSAAMFSSWYEEWLQSALSSNSLQSSLR